MFAVIDFESDSSIDVVNVDRIVNEDKPTSSFSSGQVVDVLYTSKKGATKYSGVIKSMHESKEEAEKAVEIAMAEDELPLKSPGLGRGKRIKRKKQMDSEDEEDKTTAALVKEPDLKKIRSKAEKSNLEHLHKAKKKAKKNKTLVQTSSLFDSDSDSQDEVIEKRQLVKLQNKYEELKKKTVYIEKYNDLKERLDKLKKKCEKIENLNVQLQEEVINLFKNKDKSVVVKPTPVSRSLIFSPVSNTKKTPEHSFQEVNQDNFSPSLATPIGLSDELCETESPAPKTPATKDNAGEFSVSADKLILARSNVKPGRLGDSQYAKNLASVMWDPNVLENRSVSGKSSNAVKGIGPKTQLTPQKLDLLKRYFRERMEEEVPIPSGNEIAVRMASVNGYISQKIATLNRKKPNVDT